MRVLLDEQLPRKLGHELVGHDVATVQEQGWAGLSNGDLLRAAASQRFDAFVTKDQNLEYQQNLEKAQVGVVVVVASTHDIAALRPLVPALLDALAGIRPGELRRVAA